MVQVAITDSGTGIAAEYRHKVFEPFFTTKEAGKGTGLGLALSHAIVAKHGGSLSFETRTADEVDGGDERATGTTFFVALPIADGREEAHGG
jgi:signal transduction histidine kinase